MPSLQQALTAGQDAMPPPIPKRVRSVGTVPGVRRSTAVPPVRTAQVSAVQSSAAAASLSMARMYLDGVLKSREKAIALAISLQNALDKPEGARCDTDFYLASVLVDVIGSIANERAARQHLEEAINCLGAGVAV